jgi:hypothetical protein
MLLTFIKVFFRYILYMHAYKGFQLYFELNGVLNVCNKCVVHFNNLINNEHFNTIMISSLALNLAPSVYLA